MRSYRSIDVLRWRGKSLDQVADDVVKESKLDIFVNDNHLVSLACSPSLRWELAVGYLITEGLITDLSQIDLVNVNEEAGVVALKGSIAEGNGQGTTQKPDLIAASGGRGTEWCGVKSKGALGKTPVCFRGDRLRELMEELQEDSDLFHKTGGSHSAALADNEKILFLVEDIGRHNTLDKLVGRALTEGVDPSDKAILLSGRLSSEMTVKSINSGIPVLASRSAPTDKATEIARTEHLTLVGFMRNGRMTVYSGEKRLIF
ncbi:MAG: formate dehydrogenase accessory sulfurtransferase FdhD [Candidatus Acetothermia bacterium]